MALGGKARSRSLKRKNLMQRGADVASGKKKVIKETAKKVGKQKARSYRDAAPEDGLG